MMHLSYLMGGEEIRDGELEGFGIEIVGGAGSDSRMLKIPERALPQYIDLVKEKLTKGFWNEIVGPETILFIFKFEDGHIEEFELFPQTAPQNEREIDALCARFNNESPEKTANVYKYISENDFYHDFMHEHYSDMINR